MDNIFQYTTRMKRLKKINKYTLLLNPADNLPACKNTNQNIESFSSLYIPEDKLTDKQIKHMGIAFGVRNFSGHFFKNLLDQWNTAMNCHDCTLRPLSGMHSLHIIVKVLRHYGNKILVLPEEAGGHPFTPKILNSLNFEVMPLIYNYKTQSIDIEQTIKKYKNNNPDFLLIDRSDGLFYEDFTLLLNSFDNLYSVFDASHYLTHILVNDYSSPFEMGFNLITSSMHKNFPGPQKAIIATKYNDTIWESIKEKLSNHVSNSHPLSIMCASEILLNKSNLKKYSHKMLENKNTLEQELLQKGFNIVQTPTNKQTTNHIWIRENSLVKDTMKFFRDLEFCRISTNYRKFPFQLGDGIRLGTAGATSQGLDTIHISELTDIIYNIALGNSLLTSKHKLKHLMEKINNPI